MGSLSHLTWREIFKEFNGNKLRNQKRGSFSVKDDVTDTFSWHARE